MALGLKKKNGPHNKIKNYEPRKETGREEGGLIKVGGRGKELRRVSRVHYIHA